MTAIQHWIDGLTQIANSLLVLLGVLTLVATAVWNLIQSIRNGQQIKAHGADIAQIKDQTNSINLALTTKATATDVANKQLTSDLAVANERLISSAPHPPP